MKLRLSSLARADLRGIARKVKTDNGAAVADRAVSKVIAALHHLQRFPNLGRPGREPGTRELGVASLPFIIVYRQQLTVIEVARVIHGAMLWPVAED